MAFLSGWGPWAELSHISLQTTAGFVQFCREMIWSEARQQVGVFGPQELQPFSRNPMGNGTHESGTHTHTHTLSVVHTCQASAHMYLEPDQNGKV